MFSRKKAILYLHKNGISFYVDKDSAGIQFDFDTDAVKGLGVLNPDKLQAQLATFIKENYEGSYQTLLLLSEDVIIEKSILTKDATEQRGEVQKFLEDAPFKHVGKLLYKMSGILQVVAANKDLYETVVRILSQYGWKVDAVVPIRIFGQFENSSILTESNIKDILKRDHLLKEGDLLLDTPMDLGDAPKVSEKKETKKEVDEKNEETLETPSEQSSPFLEQDNISPRSKKSFGIKSMLMILLIAVVFFGLGFFVLQSGLLSSFPQVSNLLAHATPTPSPSPLPTATPTPEPVAKNKVTIKVLNGTGKVGQAGVVKSALAKLGYISVTTDNAGNTENTTTTVLFASTIPQTNQDEIVNSLKDTFTDVKVGSTAPSGSDVEIITGTQK